MVTPYYQDDHVTLYHGDCLEILPTLNIEADVLLTDPPYFKVKQDEWDNQWDKASEFLAWMGDFLDRAKPLLTPQASVWVFASPAMTSSVERLVGERFRVLNSIRWVKERGTHSRQELATKRSFLSAWEGIVFAEQTGRIYDYESEQLRGEIFQPLGEYLTTGLEEQGHKIEDAGVRIGFSNRLGSLWRTGARVPTKDAYAALQGLAPALDRCYREIEDWHANLKKDYVEARRTLESLRRYFDIGTDRATATDVWSFDSVAYTPGKHPCEKPEPLLRHMVATSSRLGDTIIDPFAGSGSTLLAASLLGRMAVGIEKDERWCEHAANRLSQGTLGIFGGAA